MLPTNVINNIIIDSEGAGLITAIQSENTVTLTMFRCIGKNRHGIEKYYYAGEHI